MDVVFRADANRSIGMGHIMRCLSVADAFRDAGHHISFLLADDTVDKLVNMRGYETSVLHSDYSRLEEETWPLIAADIVIVDSYYATNKYLRAIKKRVSKYGGQLVYIDDVCSFPYPVDILIDYNVYSSQSVYEDLYKNTVMPSLILGPQYTPLRSMFKGLQRKVQPKKVKDILIAAGGSDVLHLTVNILRMLIEQQRSERRYHILLGAMNTDKQTIHELGEKKENIVLHENIINMKNIIISCDLAISAAGSTLYEICACGVPLITYAMADNQIRGAEAFANLGLGVNIGDLRASDNTNKTDVILASDDGVERIISASEELSMDYNRRCEIGNRMQDLIDGFGADRMVQKILEMYR